MTKPEQTRLIFLLALLAAVAGFAFLLNRDTTAGPPVFNFDAAYSPIAVENPSLRFDLLETVHKAEYKGTHRNIFSATLPPQPPSAADLAREKANSNPPQIQNVPAPIPDVVVDLKFFGYIDEPRKNLRRAFFVNPTGDEIYIAGVGDTLEQRLRVMRIGNDSVELEEISTSRRATVNIVPEDKAQ